jgi:hypothetical protein
MHRRVIVTLSPRAVEAIVMSSSWLVRDEMVKSGVEKINEIKDAGGFRDHR